MIDTVSVKQAQLRNGYFETGNGMIRILILGSCRVCPYLNYLEAFNKQREEGDMFRIFSIDPFNNHWDVNDERVNYEEALLKLETDQRLLGMLGSIDFFVHEWYANAGMFNCDKNAEKNIYQFGLSPAKDICIPNFNDYFILANDILNFDTDIRKSAIQDINVIGKLSKETERILNNKSQHELQKFYIVCRKSDLPEMWEVFNSNWQSKRFFHSYNHVSNHFTLAVFELINNKFLHLGLSKEFMGEIGKEDMFGNSYTKLTKLDIDHYGLEWDEEIVPLAL